jgi:DNA-binding transcriptional MerR regulator
MASAERAPLYPISIVSEILEIHPRTLRIYEQEELIKPARRGGKRFYSNEDLQWLRCLRVMLDDQGLNIASVKRLLEMRPCWEIVQCGEKSNGKCPASGLPKKLLGMKTPRGK